MSNRARIAPVALLSGLTVVAVGCGGGSHFKNDPRPPVPVQLSGVITDQSVTVSPNKFGAGPVVLIISNQAHQAHSVTLEGGNIRSQLGPINPLDTGKIQETLNPGHYTVKAGSSKAVTHPVKPATLAVGPKRITSSDTVDLP